jgi:hypothetical protein
MFRKLFPWAMAALIAVLAIAGCSKKPTEEYDTNYAPGSVTAYPDTVKVTVKWARNSEAESQSGFGGYYVYCTSRSMTYAGTTTDSIVGLAQLQDDSLVYFQVPGCPFSGIDSAVVTNDPTTGNLLAPGQKYYFYVRTLVDNQLSWAANWARSAPRPEGNADIYAYVPFDTTSGAKGLYSVLQFDRKSTTIDTNLFKVPISTWRDTLVDSTVLPVTTTWYDSVLCGYWPDTAMVTKHYKVWTDTTHTSTIINKGAGRKYFTAIMAPVKVANLVAKKISATQVELESPDLNTAISYPNYWGTNGLETLIQTLPGGWGSPVPGTFSSTAHNITLTVGESGNIYQMKLAGSYYAKMRVDSVTTSGNSIKVSFHYAYQLVSGFQSF